jgi:hypothetical protein
MSTILALDLGKYKSVACLYDRATAAARFHTLDTSREHLRQLFERHRTNCGEPGPIAPLRLVSGGRTAQLSGGAAAIAVAPRDHDGRPVRCSGLFGARHLVRARRCFPGS